MRPGRHVLISAGLAAMLGYWFQSASAAAACFISGVFIDIDHHLDYYLARKKFPFRYQDLLHYSLRDRHGKMYLIFHSYELLGLFWVAVYFGHLGAMWIAAGLGVSVHILCDQLVNPLRPLAYFFFYRLRHGFNRTEIFVDGHLDGIF